MIEPLQLVWIASFVLAGFLLVVLIEIHRINYRRENEVMYGTETFDEKVKVFEFTDKEKRTLEKMIRASSYENKDAIINSSGLFEAAVTNFYDFRNVDTIRDETIAAVESLRNKLGFSASNPLSEVFSTRQFNVGNRIDLYLEAGRVFKHSEIVSRNERDWSIAYDGSCGPADSLVGNDVIVRWTRPDDAVYSTTLEVKACGQGSLVLPHSSSLEKKQLRRWVRELVSFPVTATLKDGSTCEGVLFDLSAGGIMIGLPVECQSGQHINIKFTLPSFGEENVEIEILRNLGRRKSEYPNYFCLTASFSGAFGWTQERVLQYIFEVNKAKKTTLKNGKIA